MNFGQAALSRLPLCLASRLGDLLGWCVYKLSSKARDRSLDHIEIAFGDEKSLAERKSIARRSLMLMGRGLTSLLVLHRRGVPATLAQIDAVGEDVFQQAMAEHGSCLLVGGHFGLLELSAFYAGHKLNSKSVTADAREGSMSDRLVQIRADLEVGTVQRGDPRQLIRAIKEGRPVGLAIDHDVPSIRGIFVPFFGRPSHTVIGPGALAVRMQIPMVFTRIEWNGRTRHRLHLGPVLHARKDLPKSDAAMELMARATAEVEKQVRAHPADWMWLHRRWVTLPENHPELPVWTGEDAE